MDGTVVVCGSGGQIGPADAIRQKSGFEFELERLRVGA